MLIKNYKQIVTSGKRHQLLNLAKAGIEAVLPMKVMSQTIKFDSQKKILKIDGKSFKVGQGRIFVVGGGKAGGEMAESLEKIIGVGNIHAGVVNCVERNNKTKKIKVNIANHPVPDKRGLKGVKQILDLREKFMISENDLVMCLISGGGSALLPYPKDEISLADKQKVTRLLLESGAEIHEINIIRKHLSAIKGGQLAEYFAPARIITLIISDVAGNDLDTIASGPTVADRSRWKDVERIMKKYGLMNKAPKRVRRLIDKGMKGEIPETPKKLNNCHNYIIADNRLALEAIAKRGKKLGLKPLIVRDKLGGETSQAARRIARQIKSGKYKGNLIILGGETTNKLPPRYGKGGRNQHFGAVTLMALKNYSKPWAMMSVATDGVDFIEGIGGVIVDNGCKNQDIERYVKKFDSYNLFKKIGKCLIEMDNSGTNVGDVVMYMID